MGAGPDPQQLPPPGDGLLLVDKPAGWTSHDVVARVRRLCRTRRVGHAGTLDPMATGVLVLGLNRATRLLTFLVGCDKTYEATIRLGQSTVTDDAEGDITATYDVSHLTEEAVREAVAGLTGPIMQVPSSVSAIKIKGQRSYARVRAGEDVQIPARAVTVSRFDVMGPLRPVAGGCDVDVVVDVSSGTYVRALARDLGAALGTGGHLTRLQRTRVGSFTLDQAVGLHDLEQLGDLEQQPGGAEAGAASSGAPTLIPLAQAAAASFPVRALSEPEARAVGYGQRIESARPGRLEPVAALGPAGELVAVLDESRAQARSRVVFTPR